MTAVQFAELLVAGLFIGAMSGVFGVGGGALLVPMLVRIVDLSWPAAIALSLTQMVPTSAVGAWRRYQQREVHIRLALLALGGSVPGAALGRMTVRWLDGKGDMILGGRPVNAIDSTLTVFFCTAMMVMTWRMLRAPKKGAQPHGDSPPKAGAIPPAEAVLLGLGVGFTSALLGIGGGFLFVPVAVQRFGLTAAIAVGTSLFQMPVTAAVGAALYSTEAEVPYIWLVPLLIGSITGINVGVVFSRRFADDRYKLILAGMYFIVSAWLLISWAWNTFG